MVWIGEIWCCGDTDGNGLKTGLTVLTSLPGNLPGTFPDLPGLRVFSKSVSPFPFLFPEPSRTFPDCGNLKEAVSRPFPLPVSLPGSFPDCGLLQFHQKRTIMDPVSGAKAKPIINPTTYVETVKRVKSGSHILNIR